MTGMPTRPSGSGSSSVFRGLLLGVLLVAAVIVGLLAMHTLNLHGTAAADAPTTMSVSAAESDAAHHGPAPAHSSGGPTSAGDLSCAGCGTDDHAGMAMLCVLALLLVLLLLVPPSVLRGWTRTVIRDPLTTTVTGLLPRTPSLHVLCISRT